jgi:hypothetical protein
MALAKLPQSASRVIPEATEINPDVNRDGGYRRRIIHTLKQQRGQAPWTYSYHKSHARLRNSYTCIRGIVPIREPPNYPLLLSWLISLLRYTLLHASSGFFIHPSKEKTILDQQWSPCRLIHSIKGSVTLHIVSTRMGNHLGTPVANGLFVNSVALKRAGSFLVDCLYWSK